MPVTVGVNQKENNRRPEHTTAPPPEIGPLRLTNDFLVKRVFGSSHTQDILLAFVNTVLSDAGEPVATLEKRAAKGN